MSLVRCPGCGLEHPASGRPRSLLGLAASSECEAEFEPVAALFYADPDLVAARQYVVDAYTCQHPSTVSRQAVQSTALSLMTLDLVLECGFDVAQGPGMHARMMAGPAASRPRYEALAAPDLTRALNHRHVAGSVTGLWEGAAREWARSVWTAWAPHHGLVRAWNRQVMGIR